MVELGNPEHIAVFSHHPCIDGVAGACIIEQRFPDADIAFYGMGHDENKQADRVISKAVYELQAKRFQTETLDIYFVDYVPNDTSVIERLLADGHNVTIIDHHQSAMMNLATVIQKYGESENFRLAFDDALSGATLTWETLFPDTKPPALLQLIENMDVQRFGSEEEKFACCYIDGYLMCADTEENIYNFKALLQEWDDIEHYGGDSLAVFADKGRAEYQSHQEWVDQTMKSRKLVTFSPGHGSEPQTFLAVQAGPIQGTPRGVQSTLLRDLTRENPVVLMVDPVPNRAGLVNISIRVHPDHSTITANVIDTIVDTARQKQFELNPRDMRDISGGGRGTPGQMGQGACRMPEDIADALGLLGERAKEQEAGKVAAHRR